jgi:hypothetical protein
MLAWRLCGHRPIVAMPNLVTEDDLWVRSHGHYDLVIY